MKTCYIYTRVSTQKQTVEGASLETQESLLEKEAEYRGYKIAKKYCDAGISGKNIQDRPAFCQMLTDIQNPAFRKPDAVLVFKLSRFGRNAADILNSLQLLEDFGVSLICTEDSLDSSGPAGKLLISVMAAVAEIERENIREQAWAGRVNKAAQGKWNGGKPPYGYKRGQNGKLEVEEEEAIIVKKVFDLFTTTALPVTDIGRQCGITEHLVADILDRECYLGTITYGKRRTLKVPGKHNQYKTLPVEKYIATEDAHPAIIDFETFQRAQKKKADKNRHDDESYPLSRVVCCPLCSTPMYARRDKRNRDSTNGYYYCPTPECPQKRIRQSFLDKQFFKSLQDAIRDESFHSKVDNVLNTDLMTKKIQFDLSLLNIKKNRIVEKLSKINPLDASYDAQYDALSLALDEITKQEAVSQNKLAEVSNNDHQVTTTDFFNNLKSITSGRESVAKNVSKITLSTDGHFQKITFRILFPQTVHIETLAILRRL